MRALSEKRRARRRFARFLLEGPKAIGEALEQLPQALEQLLYRQGSDQSPRLEPLLERAAALELPTFPVEPKLFDDLSQVDSPQPVLAVAHQQWAELGSLLRGPDPSARRAVLACCGVQDPGNVGTILRSARFFGLGVVFLAGGQDPWNPKVVRASAGALLSQPPAQAESPAELLDAAHDAGLTPVALAAAGGQPPQPGSLPPRSLFLLGSEGQGLAPELEQGAGLTLTLPAADPGAESLNVAVTAGILAWAWTL